MNSFDGSALYAREMLARRAEQDTMFEVALRGTRAWDILLTLYVADAEGRQLTGRQVLLESNIRLEPGKRWLSLLSTEGLVIGDGELAIDVIVTIAPYAVTQLESYIERCRLPGNRRF